MQNRITENESIYRHLDKMSTSDLLHNINAEDHKVAVAVESIISDIELAVDKIYSLMKNGGRLFYIGAGTSGRLGIVDASECPPTFGVPHDWVIGLMAGGDKAMRKAVEFAEDNQELAVADLKSFDISSKDIVIGIAASGTTPYVIGGLRFCQEQNIATCCITCNPDAPITQYADYPMVCVVGPEFVTGSTRMKAGTAQKLILNMISTSVMIKLGRVEDNKMVDMQLSNDKLVDRGTKMIMKMTDLEYDSAKKLLLENGSVRAGIKAYKQK